MFLFYLKEKHHILMSESAFRSINRNGIKDFKLDFYLLSPINKNLTCPLLLSYRNGSRLVYKKNERLPTL